MMVSRWVWVMRSVLRILFPSTRDERMAICLSNLSTHGSLIF
jgi:hypothetical protein